MVVELQLKLPLDENPAPVVCAALTLAEFGVQVSAPGPLSFRIVTVPVAVLPVTPAEDDAVQLTVVEPEVVIEFGEPDPEVVVLALLTVSEAHGAFEFLNCPAPVSLYCAKKPYAPTDSPEAR
jgi:hypothetical protein